MSKQEYETTPSAPLPTAPPPPYEATFSQPPFNPHMQNAAPPYHYQPAPVIHETPVQVSQTPYPPQAYHPNPAPITASVTERRIVVGVPLLVGRQSLRTTCPNCSATIQTRTTYKSKGIAHVFCLGLCLIGCCLCSCLPYCIDSMNEIRHTCPKCNAHLGTYNN